MKDLQAQQAVDELRPLNEAEIVAVSGAKHITIDMGIFGQLDFLGGGCAAWTMHNGDGTWVQHGGCSA